MRPPGAVCKTETVVYETNIGSHCASQRLRKELGPATPWRRAGPGPMRVLSWGSSSPGSVWAGSCPLKRVRVSPNPQALGTEVCVSRCAGVVGEVRWWVGPSQRDRRPCAKGGGGQTRAEGGRCVTMRTETMGALQAEDLEGGRPPPEPPSGGARRRLSQAPRKQPRPQDLRRRPGS